MPLLTSSQLDSVKELWEVKHGVYVMQSVDDPSLFRFGSLGLKSANPAIVRLGQCHVPDPEDPAQIKTRWRYVLIDHMEGPDTPEIRLAEKALKESFKQKLASPVSWIGQKDRFRLEPTTTRDAEAAVAEVRRIARLALR
jgi:hypothetical protein